MQIRDGFIVGISHYCDQWCETCAFTAHCRSFVEEVTDHAEADPNMAAVLRTSSMAMDVPTSAYSLEALDVAATAADRPDIAEDWRPHGPVLPLAQTTVCERARAYTAHVYALIGSGALESARRDPSNPAVVISRLALLISSKTRRALRGLAELDGDRAFPSDHEGSAKVALLAIDRSQRAWEQLAASTRVSDGIARNVVQELQFVQTGLEAALPRARAFIRPGFDEPDAVAKLMTLD